MYYNVYPLQILTSIYRNISTKPLCDTIIVATYFNFNLIVIPKIVRRLLRSIFGNTFLMRLYSNNNVL